MTLLTHSKDLVNSTHNMKNPKAMKQASRTIITSIYTSIPVHVKQINTKSHFGEFGEIFIKADYFLPHSPATSTLAWPENRWDKSVSRQITDTRVRSHSLEMCPKAETT